MNMLTIAASAITALPLIARGFLWFEPDEDPLFGLDERQIPDPLHDPLGQRDPLGLHGHAPWDVPIYAEPPGLALPGPPLAQPPFGPSPYDSPHAPYDVADALSVHQEPLEPECGSEPRTYGTDPLGEPLESGDALLDDIRSDQTVLDDIESALEGGGLADESGSHDLSASDVPYGDDSDSIYYDGEQLDRLEDEIEGIGDAREEQYHERQAAAEWDPDEPDEEHRPEPRRTSDSVGSDTPDPYPESDGRRCPDYSSPPGLRQGRPGRPRGVDPPMVRRHYCQIHGEISLLDCGSCEDCELVEDEDGNERCQHLLEDEA